MQVNRDFIKIYEQEEDPWNIGAADSARYLFYKDLILSRSTNLQSALDIGCGFGAFLAHFKDQLSDLHGLEVSPRAVKKGQERFPFIQFHEGSCADIANFPALDRKFDVIICSDVIYYLPEAQRQALIKWISQHLQENGFAFIAAWCPGGRYLRSNELEALIRKELYIEKHYTLESQHSVYITRNNPKLVALTVHYEPSLPLAQNPPVDWARTVFEPTERLLQSLARTSTPLTFFVEMGSYLWLKNQDPALHLQMREQLQRILRLGHDIQLSLHSSWHSQQTSSPDLKKCVADLKHELEAVLQVVQPTYHVSCFRTNAHSAKTFKKWAEALMANDIYMDSSIYYGGSSLEYDFDYRYAYSRQQPYYASLYDPQLLAPPAEAALVELPICSLNFNQPSTLNGDEGRQWGEKIYQSLQKDRKYSSEILRAKAILQRLFFVGLRVLRPLRAIFYRFIPQDFLNWLSNAASYDVRGRYFIVTGHIAAPLDFAGIERQIQFLQKNEFHFQTISVLGDLAQLSLKAVTTQGALEEANNQVKREFNAILSEKRNAAQSYYLQDMVPPTTRTILDLGCGAGYWSARLAQLHPNAHVIGIDWGEDFLRKAETRYASERVRFQQENFSHLSFADESFDCIYADNTLEHAFDVFLALRECYRVLKVGGVLLAALPSDAYNNEIICDNHTWKTWPADVQVRLAEQGFQDIEIQEVNTFTALGETPYAPSHNKMMYVKAWKRSTKASDL